MQERKLTTLVVAVGLLVAGNAVLTTAGSPTGAAAFMATTVDAAVDGASVTTSTTVTASTPVTATHLGVCVWSASGQQVDRPARSTVRVSSSGTRVSTTKAFAAGTYTYRPCLRTGAGWHHVGTPRTFTVELPVLLTQVGAADAPLRPDQRAPASAAPEIERGDDEGRTDRAGPSASEQAMPQGDLPGWRQVLAEDFDTPVPVGQFPGPVYGSRWTGYDGFNDTWGVGRYDPKRVLSVSDGALDFHLHTADGMPRGAAPVPFLDVNCQWCGQTYGRYSIRFKADALPGYGVAWLLWPSSDKWSEGEIDFPEGALDHRISAFNHCVGDPQRNCLAVVSNASFTDWHTTTIEWRPDEVRFILDDVVIGTSPKAPWTPMRLTLQTATSGRPAPSTAGHVLIDWLTIHALER